MNTLPTLFIDKMKNLIPEDFENFYQTYLDEPFRGFRVNSLKISPCDFSTQYSEAIGFTPKKVPWCKNGFYLPCEKTLSKKSLYHAGAYYIQEPSAMAPVEFLDVQEGMRVLDLCAAPGGKTIQIAEKLQKSGLLVSNDNSLKRSRAILKNIEMFGVTNAVVTNSTPELLSEKFPMYFDRILVDAPCSGEGMFRKEPELIKSYEEVLDGITDIQSSILSNAAKMLKNNGMIVYSTCTFNLDENERIIEDFLKNHTDFKIIDPFEKYPEIVEYGFQKGFGIASARLFPHRLKGEGHFFAIMQKIADRNIQFDVEKPVSQPETHYLSKVRTNVLIQEEVIAQADNLLDNDFSYIQKGKKSTSLDIPSSKDFSSKKSKHKNFLGNKANLEERNSAINLFQKFLIEQTNIEEMDVNSITYHEGSLYQEILQDQNFLQGIRVLRNGLYLGDIHKNEFVPSSAMIMAANENLFKNKIVLNAEDSNLYKYLRRETLYFELPDGLYFVYLDKFPIGSLKIKNKLAKNLYNKNWRLL